MAVTSKTTSMPQIVAEKKINCSTVRSGKQKTKQKQLDAPALRTTSVIRIVIIVVDNDDDDDDDIDDDDVDDTCDSDGNNVDNVCPIALDKDNDSKVACDVNIVIVVVTSNFVLHCVVVVIDMLFQNALSLGAVFHTRGTTV